MSVGRPTLQNADGQIPQPYDPQGLPEGPRISYTDVVEAQ